MCWSARLPIGPSRYVDGGSNACEWIFGLVMTNLVELKQSAQEKRTGKNLVLLLSSCSNRKEAPDVEDISKAMHKRLFCMRLIC